MGQFASRIGRDIGRVSFSLLVILGVVPDCASPQGPSRPSESIVKPYVDADAYSIYATLLASDKHSFLVIQCETQFSSTATPENMGIKGNRNFYKVWGPVLKDYAKQYQTPRLLTRNIPIEVSYELVPEQRIRAIFKSEKKWDAFYELYPSSGGYYWFSAVGFDPQKTHAIVKMNYGCGMLCGGGEPHFFEKQNGKWREVPVNAEVEGWTS